MNIGMGLFAAFLVLMIFGLEWFVKKLAKKYFEKNWKALGKEDCGKKERRIWFYTVLVAILMLIFWIVAFNNGLKTIVKNEYLQSFIFTLLFLPPWLFGAVLSASRKYIRERFPEGCKNH
jgi:uncharacterized membrane protein YqhA